MNEKLEHFLLESIEENGILFKINDSNIVYFDLPKEGKITIGNYEWLGDTKSFLKKHKTLKGVPYHFRPSFRGSEFLFDDLNGAMSEELSHAILSGIKNQESKPPSVEKDIANAKILKSNPHLTKRKRSKKIFL